MNINSAAQTLAFVFLALSFECRAAESPAPEPASKPDLAATVLRLQQEVAELRGLSFKSAVPAELQSQEQFAKYMDERIDEVMPEILNKNYGAVVKRLGLYRGSMTDFRATAKGVMSSQAAAYYDPKVQKFYVLMQNMPEPMLNMLYSHELYHGLQDQYFGLDKYLPIKPEGGPALDSDQMTARQAVVEGEATYIMSLWIFQQMAHKQPTREMMAPAVLMQSQMDMEKIKAMMKLPQVSELMGGSLEEAMTASDGIPSFIMESMIGVYLKGLAFVFAVQEQGWSEVEKLYGDRPPQSTEQILHPEKWRAGEAPSIISFPGLERAAALKNWQPLVTDVLGEFQLRVIFKEQGLGDLAEAASAGWDGDRYTIFKDKNSDATLMLLATSWDDKAQAEEFATAYRQLLVKKYADAAAPTRVVQKAEDVFIVEGGNEHDINALMKVLKKSRKTKLQ
ncbi:MAG: hypothetical protein ACJ8MH_16795 [Povalibacter sp.]